MRNLKAVGYVFDTDTLDKVTVLVKDLQDGIVKLEGMLAEGGGHSKLDHAKHLCNAVLPAMLAIQEDLRTARGHDRGRLVAVGDLPGNALHHVGPGGSHENQGEKAQEG